jgi:hypothetical protein
MIPKTKIPRKATLVGIGKSGDIYMTPRGKLYAYTGEKRGDFKKVKFWERLDRFER